MYLRVDEYEVDSSSSSGTVHAKILTTFIPGVGGEEGAVSGEDLTE